MAITVTVRAGAAELCKLTFDASQRVVLGRGAGSDVRLPEPSVSHRHASVRMKNSDLVIVDEGSTNGTFVGGVRIAPWASRIVRSGDSIRLGRVWIELRMDQGPSTRDAAMATRDLALAFIAQALDAAGADRTTRLRVVEGPDQGTTLSLAEANRDYLIGRAAHCDLALSDEDASREHAAVVRRSGGVAVRDLGAKNGTWLGEARVLGQSEAAWRPLQMLKVARSVMALEEPISQALAHAESVPDEPLEADEVNAVSNPISTDAKVASPIPPFQLPDGRGDLMVARVRTKKGRLRRFRWSIVDTAVMAAALGVLALSLAALVWVLRG
jgi:pSer/pThr/pTyr-binding forkhead associated (FHA) protein